MNSDNIADDGDVIVSDKDQHVVEKLEALFESGMRVEIEGTLDDPNSGYRETHNVYARGRIEKVDAWNAYIGGRWVSFELERDYREFQFKSGNGKVKHSDKGSGTLEHTTNKYQISVTIPEEELPDELPEELELVV